MSMTLFCHGPQGTGKSHVATVLALAEIDRILGVVEKPTRDGSSSTRNKEVCEEFKGRVLALSVPNAALDDILMKYYIKRPRKGSKDIHPL